MLTTGSSVINDDAEAIAALNRLKTGGIVLVCSETICTKFGLPRIVILAHTPELKGLKLPYSFLHAAGINKTYSPRCKAALADGPTLLAVENLLDQTLTFAGRNKELQKRRKMAKRIVARLRQSLKQWLQPTTDGEALAALVRLDAEGGMQFDLYKSAELQTFLPFL
jgi:hypothetical protein